MESGLWYLHSTMFLLNQRSVQHLLHLKLNLHSTMFLLNQDGSEYNEDVVTYLHSTMFLLNQKRYNPLVYWLWFTFHYVSIKSLCFHCKQRKYSYLHSTMFLLNPVTQKSPIFRYYQSIFCRLSIFIYYHLVNFFTITSNI